MKFEKKFEVWASRSKSQAADVVSGTVFDESGNSESFIVSRWRDSIYLCVSRGLLVKKIYDLFSKILKKYVRCTYGPLVRGRSTETRVPLEIDRLMDENWMWSEWIPEEKTYEERQKLAEKVIDEIWKMCSQESVK